MKNRILVTFSIFVLLALSACTTDSDDLNTSGIEADMQVIVGSSQAVARADLSVAGGSGPVDLSSNDKLYVSSGLNITKTLYRAGKEGRYEATFATSEFSAVNATFRFNLQREDNQEDDAPNSTVTVPTGFNIIFPSANSEFVETDAIDLTWDNGTTGSIDIDMTSTCEDDKTPLSSERDVTTEDDSAYTIGNLDQFYPVIGNVDCELKIEMSRKNTGNADSNLGRGSEIAAERSDKVTVKLLAD